MEWCFESADQVYPSMMRTEIMAVLHDKGALDSDFAAAELIYGELISNVIRHAHGRITVRLEWNSEFPTLSVSDEERYAAPAINLPADPFAESGRGLYIVQALARDFVVVDGGAAGSAARATLPIKRRVSAR